MSFLQNKFETVPNVFHEGLVFNIVNHSFHKIDFIRGRRDLRVGEVGGGGEEFFALRAWTIEKGEVRVVQVNLDRQQMVMLAAGIYKYIAEVTRQLAEGKDDDNTPAEDTREEGQEPAMAFEHDRGEGWRHVTIPVRKYVVEQEKESGNPTVGFMRVFRENEKTEELYGASGSVDGQPVKVGGAPSAADAIRMFGNAVDAIKKLSKDRAEGTTPNIEPDAQKPEKKGPEGEGQA